MRIDDLLEDGAGLICIRDRPSAARAVQRAARTGQVVPVLPGVYADSGKAASIGLRLRAACAWSASGVIHGRTAAQLHLRQPVSLPIRLRAPYRGTNLPAWLRVSVGTVTDPLVGAGVRVATAAHCAVELAGSDRGETIFEMLRRGLVTTEQLDLVRSEFSGTLGNRERTAVVKAALDNPWSFGEVKLQDLLRKARISGWVANRGLWVLGHLLFPDIRFREQRLVLEFDGEAVHSSHDQFEDDRRRQNLLVLAGFRVLRFTWEAVTQRPEQVIETIRMALSRSAVANSHEDSPEGA